MLSVIQISNRIKNPNLVVPKDLLTLQELSTKYPYTQLFSILYLKALSKAGDPRFEEELSRHSYRISDRVQLYELIQDHDETESLEIPKERVESQIEVIQETEVSAAPVQKVIEEETTVSDRESSDDETTVPEKDPMGIEPAEGQTTIAENEPITVETETELEAIVFETEVEQSLTEVESEAIVEETKIKPKDNLEESILHHVYAANYRLDDLTEEEETTVSDREPSGDQSYSGSKREGKAVPNEQETSSFTDWLHCNNNYAERDASDKEAINAVVGGFSEFDPSSELFGEVEKPRTEFFSPAKKAKKSLEESELPVSETLAKIYTVQGNYPQAISAYKQLSLAFPEKKIFFANLIEDLEKKINT